MSFPSGVKVQKRFLTVWSLSIYLMTTLFVLVSEAVPLTLVSGSGGVKSTGSPPSTLATMKLICWIVASVTNGVGGGDNRAFELQGALGFLKPGIDCLLALLGGEQAGG